MGFGTYAEEAAQTSKSAAVPVETTGLGITTIAACLATGEQNLQLEPFWNAINEEQQTFIENLLPVARRLAESLPVETAFSDKAEVLNEFFRARGFTIEFQPFRPDEYGAAAVMKLTVVWREEGVEDALIVNDQRYQSAVFDTESGVTAFRVPGHSEPIALLETKDGKKMLLTKLGDTLAQGSALELFLRARELVKHPERTPVANGGLIFPATELDAKPDLSWFLGAWTLSSGIRRCKISQAFQQIKLKMDHIGARIEEATGMGFALECMRTPLPKITIDGPYLAALLVPVDREDEVACAFRVGPDAWIKA